MKRMELIKRRQVLGLTQGEMAKKARVSMTPIVGLEAGESFPHPRNLPNLARAYDIPTVDFVNLLYEEGKL